MFAGCNMLMPFADGDELTLQIRMFEFTTCLCQEGKVHPLQRYIFDIAANQKVIRNIMLMPRGCSSLANGDKLERPY